MNQNMLTQIAKSRKLTNENSTTLVETSEHKRYYITPNIPTNTKVNMLNLRYT